MTVVVEVVLIVYLLGIAVWGVHTATDLLSSAKKSSPRYNCTNAPSKSNVSL
jgi:hypothetical protein